MYLADNQYSTEIQICGYNVVSADRRQRRGGGAASYAQVDIYCCVRTAIKSGVDTESKWLSR